MDYKETVELEENVKIKNKADGIYRGFMNNVKLNVRDFSDGKFKVWSDSHNATYVSILNGVFTFQCRFLHESYNIDITPECIFSKIKSDYRGLGHLTCFITKSTN